MGQDARCRRNGNDVVARRPDQVLDHLAVGCPGKTYDRRNIVGVAFDKDDVGRFYCHVRARADGNADIRLG